MMGTDPGHVTALNVTNAAMGIFVVGIFLAVALAAAVDAAAAFRRWRRERGERPGLAKPASAQVFPAVRLNEGQRAS